MGAPKHQIEAYIHFVRFQISYENRSTVIDKLDGTEGAVIVRRISYKFVEPAL